MEEVAVEEQQIEASVEDTATTDETIESAQEEQPQPLEPPAPTIADLEAALSETRVTLEQRDTELQTLRHQLTSATESYRKALLAASPEVQEELVTGSTPEDVEASLAQARQMVERIRTHIESQLAEQRVPTGAPIRSAQDLSSLSPQEKIAYALAQQEQGR